MSEKFLPSVQEYDKFFSLLLLKANATPTQSFHLHLILFCPFRKDYSSNMPLSLWDCFVTTYACFYKCQEGEAKC